jgi:flagellar biosynthesis/type III secretory pathway protein FliH
VYANNHAIVRAEMRREREQEEAVKKAYEEGYLDGLQRSAYKKGQADAFKYSNKPPKRKVS